MGRHQKEDLLDTLAKRADCVYLSELRNHSCYPVIVKALKGIDPNSYSLFEWEEAIYYITGERQKAEDPLHAVKCLKERLQQDVSVANKQ